MAQRFEVPHSARRILNPGRCKGESTELSDKVKTGINLIRSCRKLQYGLLVLTEYACLECKYITQLILKIQKKVAEAATGCKPGRTIDLQAYGADGSEHY